jgi:hypothetical protein
MMEFFMRLHCWVCIAAFVLMSATAAFGQPVPVLNVQQLVDEADLIIVGSIHSVSETGSVLLDVHGRRTPAKALVADILPDRVLKGAMDGPIVRVSFALPGLRAGYGRVFAGTYELTFLKRNGRDYEFVNPYYPALPAVPGPLEGDAPGDRVANAIAAQIESASTENRERINAIHALGTINNSTSIAALRKALGQSDENVRLSAAAILLEMQDLTGLAPAEQALLGDTTATNDAVLHNMRYAISELSASDAIPALVRLLKSQDDLTRRAVASGLRKVRSPQTISALAAALDDRDWEVRYYAVRGLAEITGENSWGPSIEVFRASEDKYLNYWKGRARQQK